MPKPTEKRLAVLGIPREYLAYFLDPDRIACHLVVTYRYGSGNLDPKKFNIVSLKHDYEQDTVELLIESPELPYSIPGSHLGCITIEIGEHHDFGARMSELHQEYEELLKERRLESSELKNLVNLVEDVEKGK